MDKVKRRTQRLTFYVCRVSMFILMPVMLLTVCDVIGRASLWPIPGVVELSEYGLAVFILLGLAYTQQMKGHPRISFAVSRLSLQAQAILEIIITLLCLFMIFILIWQGWIVGFRESAFSDMLRIPQLPFRLLVCVGAFLFFLELLVDLVTSAGKLKNKL